MNRRWLFLRGAIPTDRDPREIEHDTLTADDDMWIHLFSGLIGDTDDGHVIYYNAPVDKCFIYRNNFTVWHYPDIMKISGQWDYVFARGGFPIYDLLMPRLSGYKIYYGAGKRYYPPIRGFNKYDLVLVDSDRQRRDVLELYPKIKCEKLIKPAAPLFYPCDVKKEFDCCLVAGVPNPCKMVQWVYDTCPRDISILQLGYMPDGMIPENVTVRRVPRWEMPVEMCRCRVGIVPYTGADSCPRVIPEFMACGVMPVVCSDVNCGICDNGYGTPRNNFWGNIKAQLKNAIGTDEFILAEYLQNLSLPVAVYHLKKIIGVE